MSFSYIALVLQLVFITVYIRAWVSRRVSIFYIIIIPYTLVIAGFASYYILLLLLLLVLALISLLIHGSMSVTLVS